MKFDNKYFEIPGGIIHIKEVHNSMASVEVLVEVDDYCGDMYKVLENKKWLNNGTLFFDTSYTVMKRTFKEVTTKEFHDRLIKEISHTIHQIKMGESCPLLYWRKTPVRIDTLRKHYGTK